MSYFAIVELDDGLTVVQVYTGQSPEEAAARDHGLLIDPGPYHTYEEACDAMAELESNNEESRY